MKRAATPKGDGSQSFPARTSTLDPLAAYRDRCRPSIPSRADVELASSLIPRPNPDHLSRFGWMNTKRSVRTFEQPKYFLNVGPGLVSITKKLMAPKVKFWDDEGMTDDGPTRGRVKEWSSKSKNRMTQTLESLDYEPMFTGYAPAAMVTLSLPGEGWEQLVPDIPTFKKMINKLCIAYGKAWGDQIRGVWKMEFQRRGAPHLHILMVPPVGLSRGRGVTAGKNFSSWLAIRWAQIVGASGTALRDHSLHGTHINFAEMSRYSDPRRIGSYFSKHGTFSEKDYQNQMPEHWQRAIAEGRSGGGNFWGYWGLEKAISTVELTTREGSAYRQHRRELTQEEPMRARFQSPDEEGAVRYRSIMSSDGSLAHSPA